MNAITLTDEQKAMLGRMDRSVEVRDERGRVVGTFVPQAYYHALLAKFYFSDPPPPKGDGPPIPASEINDMLLERMKR